MSYIGGLTKTELSAFLINEYRSLLQEMQALRLEVGQLRTELSGGDKQLHTIEDLTQLFKVSRATIHNWVNQGKLIKHKIGGKTLFKDEDVRKIIKYSKK